MISPARATCKSLRTRISFEQGAWGSRLNAAPMRANIRASVTRQAIGFQSPRGHRIGPGSGAIGLGEPARLQRVDLDQGDLLTKRHLEGLVIRPRRLEHDPRHRGLAQPSGQSTKSRDGIIEALRRTIFQPEHVQMGFGNVHANAMICYLLRVLCLSCVTCHTRIRSGPWGRRRLIKLWNGPSRPSHLRSNRRHCPP